MASMKIRSFKNTLFAVFRNVRRMLGLSWEMGHGLTIGYFGTSALSALFPIIISFTYKLLVDALIAYQGTTVSIPLIIVAILGSRYLINLASEFIGRGLRGFYFDFLFRNRLQNILNYKFYKKVSSLDIAHFENPDTQNLITKAEDTFTWRPPEFLRSLSFISIDITTYISSFLILLPYGIIAPVVLTFAALPTFIFRVRYGKVHWSIYGSGSPQVKRLWYFKHLLAERNSITELRIFQSTRSILNEFKDIQDELFDLYKKPVVAYVKVMVIPQFIELFSVGIFSLLALPRVLSGEMSVGTFTFFVSLLDRLVESASSMVSEFGGMYENNLYVNHYFEVMDLKNTIEVPQNPSVIPSEPNPPKVEFKNVTFRYPGSGIDVLKDVSFTIEPGENIAIVGVNGAGKTTIVKLLCRFYDVTEGEILINGVNIKDVSLNKWYEYLGTLFQEFIHYNLTVSQNIMMGDTSVKDQQKMKLAAEASGADAFIKELPKKYNQVLGRRFEEGVELSQGQWQKLAIARAFYEGAPILILDEPTSAIDAEAEYKIFHSLQKLYKDKSLFLISHRFSTVRNADKILVLKGGKVMERGNHESLMQQNGHYARMFAKQAIGYK